MAKVPLQSNEEREENECWTLPHTLHNNNSRWIVHFNMKGKLYEKKNIEEYILKRDTKSCSKFDYIKI